MKDMATRAGYLARIGACQRTMTQAKAEIEFCTVMSITSSQTMPDA